MDSGFLGGNKGAEANMMANVYSQTNLDLLEPERLHLDSIDRLEKIYCADESKTRSPVHPQSTSEPLTILIIRKSFRVIFQEKLTHQTCLRCFFN